MKWHPKFEELAKYNLDKNKEKYTEEYKSEMAYWQGIYDMELVENARKRGFLKYLERINEDKQKKRESCRKGGKRAYRISY